MHFSTEREKAVENQPLTTPAPRPSTINATSAMLLGTKSSRPRLMHLLSTCPDARHAASRRPACAEAPHGSLSFPLMSCLSDSTDIPSEMLSLRMGLPFPDPLPSQCPSCGETFDLAHAHALKCKRGGWLHRHAWKRYLVRGGELLCQDPRWGRHS